MNNTRQQWKVTPSGEVICWWVGIDGRGVELEIAANVVVLRTADLALLVFHVMPTALRQRQQKGSKS